jgi:triacylglycerol lipase
MSTGSPVLLIHGLGDTSKLFRRMASRLKEAGREVHALDLLPNNGNAGLDRLALQVDAYVERNFAAGQTFDLVGFSMGGIVSRYYLQRLGGMSRVRRFITISSPHRGTWTAYLRGNPGIRQMRRDSEFLRDLNRDCADLERVGFVSIWTRFDLMILPASSSVLPAGRSIHVGAIAHPLMVRDRRVLRLVHEILDAPA